MFLFISFLSRIVLQRNVACEAVVCIARLFGSLPWFYLLAPRSLAALRSATSCWLPTRFSATPPFAQERRSTFVAVAPGG